MTKPEAPARRSRWFAPSAALLVALALPLLCRSQAVAPASQASVQARSAMPHAPAARSGSKTGAAPKPMTRPPWRELSPGQQQALAPLAAHWDTLNEAQKRKWIALSANFPKMSGGEQEKLHSRMTEWVALSPQQRTIARLNFGQTRKLSPDDKKAKWEAYQALSPEEKSKLAAKAARPPTTAAAVRPVPAEKLATVPKAHRERAAKAPRIAAAPNQVDHNTLLPQQAPAAVQPPGEPQAQPTHQPTLPVPPQAGTPD